MLETIRKYWIGGLVLVMVGLHASIVGLIRHQASLAKVDISCEVDLGEYLAYPNENNTPVSMRLHAIVPLNHRVKSRQLIELNQAQIRQAIEEHIRQVDHRVLRDPYLSDLRTQLLDVLVQTIGSTSVEDLAITELQKTSPDFALSFTNASHPKRPKLVATLRSEIDATAKDDKQHSDAEHDSHGHDEHGEDGHASNDHSADQHADEHAAENHDAANSHGAASDHKSQDGHDASGHGADGSTDHGGAKSGHDAADGHGKPKTKAKAAVKYTPGMGKKKKEDAGGHGGGH
ncbi:MAG: hypothetical protein MUC83_04365 [Pirellula sp.]|jgi:hypothetical protein|nr:hypothetical protein [Pirellula sp.]